MKNTLNTLLAVLLVAIGMTVFFVNPNRSTTLLGGILLQLPFAALVFALTIQTQQSLGRFKAYARKDPAEKKKEDPKWILGSLIAFLLFGGLLMIGVGSGWLRFFLFIFMWGAAMVFGETLGTLVWCRVNRNWLEESFKRDAIEEAAKQSRLQQDAELKEKQKKSREDEIAAKRDQELKTLKHEIAEVRKNARDGKFNQDLLRFKYPADPNGALALTSWVLFGWEKTMGYVDEAINNPSPLSLASVESAIAFYAGDENVRFFNGDAKHEYSDGEVQTAKLKILGLARSGQLMVDPAYSQCLVAATSRSPGMHESLLEELSSNPQQLCMYKLLRGQMILSIIVRPDYA